MPQAAVVYLLSKIIIRKELLEDMSIPRSALEEQIGMMEEFEYWLHRGGFLWGSVSAGQ